MQSWLEGRIWVGKGAQATGMTASLRIQSSKADSNTWESFTRSGLKLESVHQESPHSDVFRKRATKPLLNQRQRQKRLTWAVEKKNWTVAQWSKVLFSDESKFCISFGIKVPESGAEHVSGAERGASAERSVRNIVGARSGFLSKGRSDRSVSLLFHSDTAHTTSLGHAQIHPEFTCAFNN